MGRSQQRKGRAAERELAGLFRRYSIPAEPGQAFSYGATPDIVGVDGIHVEVKRAETAKIWAWMEQSQRDAQRFQDGAPTVIFRRSRSDWLICMGLTDWLQLYEKAHNRKCGGHCNQQKQSEMDGIAPSPSIAGKSGQKQESHDI